MKIACKSADICIKSNYPKFKYHFKVSGVPISVENEHAEKILLNSDFYESDKPLKKIIKPTNKTEKKKTWEEELGDNFTKEEINKIIKEFKTKGELLEALSNEKNTFSEQLGTKLKEVFINLALLLKIWIFASYVKILLKIFLGKRVILRL